MNEFWARVLGIKGPPLPASSPASEYAELRDRIKAALARIEGGTASDFGGMTGAEARAFVNYVTGANIQNGPLLETMQLMAEACEAAAGLQLPDDNDRSA